MPISIDEIQVQANEFEKKRLTIKNAVIDFFTKNPNEALDSNDKIIVYNTTDNTIQTQSKSYQLSESEQQITISKNTKSEITQKRLEMAQKKTTRLESEKNELGASKSELRAELDIAKKESLGDRIIINQFIESNYDLRTKLKIGKDASSKDNEKIDLLEYEKMTLILLNSELQNKLKEAEERAIESESARNESNRLLKKLEEALGIEDTKIMNLAKLPTTVSAWLGDKDSQSLTTGASSSSNNLASSWLPPATSFDDRLVNCLQALENLTTIKSLETEQLAQKLSEKKESTESLDKLLQKIEKVLGINMTKSSEHELSATTAWLPGPDSQSLPTNPDSSNKASSWLPPAPSIDDRLETCLKALENLTTIQSLETASEKKSHEKLINLLDIIEKNIPQQQESKIESTNLQERIDNASNYLKSLSSSSLVSLSSSSESAQQAIPEITNESAKRSQQANESEKSLLELSLINDSLVSNTTILAPQSKKEFPPSEIVDANTLAQSVDITSCLQLVELSKEEEAKTLITAKSASALQAIKSKLSNR